MNSKLNEDNNTLTLLKKAHFVVYKEQGLLGQTENGQTNYIDGKFLNFTR